ncbi:hypothetical protein VTJ49DRAFT_597 [Mycothermus thermophilus]|uniref:TrfA protein n=1 Tax=Humicola insolens TaxID=85995 RepID=A0ABR3VEL8_HUMIN
MAPLSVPTTARLPSTLRVDPSNPTATRILGRLSRPSLISVALDWLDDGNLPLAQPYLREPTGYDDDDDEDEYDSGDFYPPARSVEALREIYISMQARKGSKREVLDRILEGDWRHGLTLYQLAMADLQYLYDHPTSQKWSAYRIVPLKPPTDPSAAEDDHPPEVDDESLAIPRFHPSTFLRSLQAQVLPDLKAHYNFDAHKTLPLLILRIFIIDSPYNTSHGFQASSSRGRRTSEATTSFDSARTIYIAFPDGSPHVFISKPQTSTTTNSSIPATTTSSSSSNPPTSIPGTKAGESSSLLTLLINDLPKALSRPQKRERFTLQPTSLVTRNLAELVHRRGAGRTNAAGGGWSVYAGGEDEEGDGKGGNKAKRGEGGVGQTPLDLVLPSPPLSGDTDDEDREEGGGKRPAAATVGLSAADEMEQRAVKRARLVARARFGRTATIGDGKGVERVDVVVEDEFVPSRKEHQEREDEDNDEDEDMDAWRPRVRLTFHGPHVFAGIRQLVECGIVDGEKMPGWMTGEEGVTVGAVRKGRIRGHKGSGIP